MRKHGVKMKKENHTLFDYKEIRPIAIELRLIQLENQRLQLYRELISNLFKIDNGSEYEDREDRRKLCKIYMYETKKLDEKIKEIRELMLRRTK